MKGFRLFICLLCLAVPLLSCGHRNETLIADCAFVLCPETGLEAYFSGSTEEAADPDTPVHPASITKLVTAMTALEILPPETLITPGDEVWFPPEGASSAFIRPIHTLTLEMLVEGMLVPSGDDAAYAAAAACGYRLLDDASPEDAVSAFVDRMNRTARELGCTGSDFTVPDGFAWPENRSTLGDMAKISAAALDYPLILKYAGTFRDEVVYASGHINTWVNTNKMLDPQSKYYDSRVSGLKTGSLKANYSLVVLYERGGRTYLVGVFGAESDAGRYRDVRTLIRWIDRLDS